jgi:predicted hydrocarbon binding protein
MEVQDPELHRKIYASMKKNVKSDLTKQFDVDFGLNREKALELMMTFFTASGWGKVQTIDLDFNGKRAILLVENSPVAQALKGKVSWPVDVMLRGIFAGIFSNAFGVDVDCVESECAALKAQACKFIIKPQSEFDLSTREVRDQLVFE